MSQYNSKDNLRYHCIHHYCKRLDMKSCLLSVLIISFYFANAQDQLRSKQKFGIFLGPSTHQSISSGKGDEIQSHLQKEFSPGFEVGARYQIPLFSSFNFSGSFGFDYADFRQAFHSRYETFAPIISTSIYVIFLEAGLEIVPEAKVTRFSAFLGLRLNSYSGNPINYTWRHLSNNAELQIHSEINPEDKLFWGMVFRTEYIINAKKRNNLSIGLQGVVSQHSDNYVYGTLHFQNPEVSGSHDLRTGLAHGALVFTYWL